MTRFMKRHMSLMATLKVILVSLLGGVLMFGPAAAQIDQGQAEEFTKTLVLELGEIAQNETLSDEAQNTAFREALERRLAAESIGKFLFKGVPEELPTPAQIETYNQLFPSYIAAAFASQIGGLAERQINVTDSRVRGDKEVIVRSELVNKKGQKKASIDWRVRWIDGQPRLLDVLVERTSPLVSKRQEFSSLAKRKGVDAILTHMKTTIN